MPAPTQTSHIALGRKVTSRESALGENPVRCATYQAWNQPTEPWREPDTADERRRKIEGGRRNRTGSLPAQRCHRSTIRARQAWHWKDARETRRRCPEPNTKTFRRNRSWHACPPQSIGFPCAAA